MASAKSVFDKSTLIVMPNKNHRTRRYRDNFKQAAADFVERNGWSVEQSATELGVDAAELRDWTTKLGSRQKPSKSLSGIAQLRAESTKPSVTRSSSSCAQLGHPEDHSWSSLNDGLLARSGVRYLYNSPCTAFPSRSLISFWRSGSRIFAPHRSVT